MAQQKRRASGTAITVQEAGRRGGQAVKAKYGLAFYEAIGRKGGRIIADRRGKEYYARLGKKGGERVLALHGIIFFERIGKKSGEITRRGGACQNTLNPFHDQTGNIPGP